MSDAPTDVTAAGPDATGTPRRPDREDGPDRSDQVASGRTGASGAARTALVVAGCLVVVALCGFGATLLWAERSGADEQDARAAVLTAARQEALNLIAVDGTDTDADIAEVLAGATGSFAADFAARADELKRVIAGAEVVSSDLSVSEAAVVRLDGDSAVVLVAADSIVKNAAKPEGAPRSYRMLLELERRDGRWLTSSLEVVG